MSVAVRRDDLGFWAAGPGPLPHPPLRGEHRCDVAVVGGGFTGLSAAYHLVRERPGLDVVLVEAHTVGSGASGRNTGILRPGVGGTVLDLCRRHGEDVARALYSASLDAVDAVVDLIEGEGIDCELERVPHVKLALTAHHALLLRREADTLARLGFGVETYDDTAALAPVPAVAGLCYPQGGQLNPALLCRGLTGAVAARGVRVHERSPVRRLVPGRPVRLELDHGWLVADQVVLATNGYTARLGPLSGRVVPLQTHVSVTEPLTPAQLSALRWAGRRSFSDKRHVFDYYRLTRDGRLMFGGGRPVYRVGRTDIADPRVWAEQRRTFRATFPALAELRITHQWSGTMGMTADRFPLVGEQAPGVLFAGGWSGHGVALATASGALVADLLHGRDTTRAALPWTRARAPWLPPDPLRAAGLAAYVAGLRLADRIALRRERARRTPHPDAGA